jgi:nucleoside-diphosphate-sugar epimerase
MRVLITGGAGFIGSHLVRACLEPGDAVRLLGWAPRVGLAEGIASTVEHLAGEQAR